MPGQPFFVSTSLWQIPQACTLMRTCPAPGLGISRSTISKSPPALGTCATFIGATPILVVAILPPFSCVTILVLLSPTDNLRHHGNKRITQTQYFAFDSVCMRPE